MKPEQLKQLCNTLSPESIGQLQVVFWEYCKNRVQCINGEAYRFDDFMGWIKYWQEYEY